MSASSIAEWKYPETRRENHVDLLHGHEIHDPYRWMENPPKEEITSWIEQQNQITRNYLDAIPVRQKLEARLREIWNYERFGLPIKRGNTYFVTRNDGLQNQSVLYHTKNLGEELKVLLDPNQLSEDGTAALSSWAPSPDGARLAYGISLKGSDWQEWRVINVETGEHEPDLIQWVKFSRATWDAKGEGFYYSRYAAPEAGAEYVSENYNQKLYYHRLGTSQSEDRLIHEDTKHPEWGFSARETEDGHYLILNLWHGTRSQNALYYQDLTIPNSPIVKLLPEWDASYSFLFHEGRDFWILTDSHAPRGRVIKISLDHPTPDAWTEVIPQHEHAVLESVSRSGDRLILQWLENVQSKLEIRNLEGAFLKNIPLPGPGSVYGLGGRISDDERFYLYTSFTSPGTVYRYQVSTGENTVFKKPVLKIDLESWVTEQVFVTSKDDTQIPVFITRHQNAKPNGQNPVLLYGYGGFSASLSPGFSLFACAWLEQGGIYAVANLRGGGEFGESWHQAGMKHKKQNVFDDFIAAAEWFIKENWTRPEKLAIAGGSNGGLLVGACLNQRPDLFAAGIPAVGVMDMLRFHQFTIGWGWMNEYGSPEIKDDFENLLSYSPYHQLKHAIKSDTFPAVLVLTGDHDDRVVPAHSYKYLAELQFLSSKHQVKKPTLIRIETNAGHGAGKPTEKSIQEAADKLTFLMDQLGVQE